MNATQNQPLILAQLADPQIGFKDYEGELARFRREIDLLNADDCQAVVICGDMMHLTSRESLAFFQEELARLRKPVYLVAGNHDVGQGPSSRQLFEERFGPTFYAVDLPGGAQRLVVLDTDLWQNPASATAVMDDFLQAELTQARSSGQRLVLAVHVPVFIDSVGEAVEYFNLPLERRKWLLELLEGSSVAAVLSGHSHTAFAFVWKGILFSGAETTSDAFDKVNYGYRRLVFDGDWLRFSTVPVLTP
jgi:3',5'-cyclic AMP phosphodiesterase CpdA